MNNVRILNPHDSQGNHVADGSGVYPCLRGCGGAGYQQGYVLQHLDEDECLAVDLYNQQITGDKASTLQAFSCMTATRGGPHMLIVKAHHPVQAIGVDLYNQTTTGEISKTLNAIRSDSDHTPVVIYSEVDHG